VPNKTNQGIAKASILPWFVWRLSLIGWNTRFCDQGKLCQNKSHV